MENTETVEKKKLYKTAIMAEDAVRLEPTVGDYFPVAYKGEHVSVEYAGYDLFMGHYYDVETIEGKCFTAFEQELTEFVL